MKNQLQTILLLGTLSAALAVAQQVPAHVEPATASLFIVSPLAGRRVLA